MMCKRIISLLALLMILSTLTGGSARAEAIDILVLYETTGTGVVEEQIKVLSDILLYMINNVKYLQIEEAMEEDLALSDHIILLVDETYTMRANMAESLRACGKPVLVIGSGGLSQLVDSVVEITDTLSIQYNFSSTDQYSRLAKVSRLLLPGEVHTRGGGFLETKSGLYPLCATIDNITHFALLDVHDFALQSALATEISRWLWPFDNAPHAFSSFVVLDDVSPVDDVNRLYAAAELLEDEGIPYAISVMPVYDNGNYPAMQRFCEALRYLQSRGAVIIMRTPLVRLDEVDVLALKERIEWACDVYVQYGVYPLALKAPKSYIHSEPGIDVLRGFRTVFLFETDDVDSWDLSCLGMLYKDGHQLIAPDGGSLHTNAYSSAIYLSINDPIESLAQTVHSLQRGHVPLRSLSTMSHSCYYNGDTVQYTPKSGLFINGQRDSLTYTPFVYEENFDYQRDIINYLTNQIAATSQVLLIVVLFSAAAFIVCILFARRLMRKHFLKQKLRHMRTEAAEWV